MNHKNFILQLFLLVVRGPHRGEYLSEGELSINKYENYNDKRAIYYLLQKYREIRLTNYLG